MKLEDKFFNSFFYPFLVAVILSTLIVTTFLGIFTNNTYDKRTSEKIINLEKEYAKINLNAVNVIMTTKILKLQASLNEIIHFYDKIANDLLRNPNSHKLQTKYIKCAVNIDLDYCDTTDDIIDYMADWVLDKETTEDNLDEAKKEVRLQLTAFSNVIPNIYGILQATLPHAYVYYFYFVDTDLYSSYPLGDDCFYNNFAYRMGHFNYEETTCMDDKGEFYTVYKVQCEAFFQNIIRSKTGDFDYNYQSFQHKSIFVNNFYYFVEAVSVREFSMCIEFFEPITKGKAYACVDADYSELIPALDDLNSNLFGYYFISNVGFNNVFYFPQSLSTPLIPTEYIYNWDANFKLEEKDYFNYYRKIFSSNYLDNLGKTVYDEVFVNGKNDSGQFFYVNEKKFRYSIYPILLDNLNGQKEHIFSVIYIYNDELFFEELKRYSSTSLELKILLEFIIFIVFGSGLLYLIYLTFNILSKYIVIPIKNVNYMLKGINIGGENRLKYLDFLKRKQDENIEILEKMSLLESKSNNKSNELVDYKNNIKKNNEDDYQDDKIAGITKNQYNQNISNINPYDEFDKKYDEESNYIEKEYNFYDFDDQLLQYRSLEIERLVKSLMDLKGALYLTSHDREVGQIIDYSSSEEIFKNFKIQEGAIICESNIGNLQGQLLKFDKAIYHLVLSIQDNNLKRFISKGLNDELDKNDSLFYRISNYFNKENKKVKNNRLAKKQMDSSKDNFSQQKIGILINTRYSRLIHVYYMFFKNLEKYKKSNNNIIDGQFMNTLYHTIDYYHKIIIQFIYLSYVKNDLVKIGESILDYLEFLIKFKFKASSNEKDFLEFNTIDRPEYFEKIEFKKKIFIKIMNWFNLFDDYITYVKDYTSLDDLKGLIDNYSQSLNSENNEFNWESQGTLLFRINIQRSDFLKGKFALCCQNYNDALFYFIRAAKIKSLVIDGLIKKKSLKHIYKITLKMKKFFANFKLQNLNMEKEIKDSKKNNIYNQRRRTGTKKTNRSFNQINSNIGTFGEAFEKIKKVISEDINDCDEKQKKDIFLLIDFNLYNNKQEENLYTKTYKIEAFIEQAIIILNNYLSTYDRLCVLNFINEYQIICPLMPVNEIDTNNFSKDLINSKIKAFNENTETDEYDILSNDLKINDFEIDLDENLSDNSLEESFITSEIEEKNFIKINGIVKTINFLNKYSKMKEGVKNEKYIILFSEMLNIEFIDEEQVEKILNNIYGDKRIIFLFVGKAKILYIKNEKNNNVEINKKLEKIILNKFNEKSEVIYFENMKKIKSILSNNNFIKDEIIYPNEIY